MVGLEVHLVRVTTDDGARQLWLAAAPREEAVDRGARHHPRRLGCHVGPSAAGRRHSCCTGYKAGRSPSVSDVLTSDNVRRRAYFWEELNGSAGFRFKAHSATGSLKASNIDQMLFERSDRFPQILSPRQERCPKRRSRMTILAGSVVIKPTRGEVEILDRF